MDAFSRFSLWSRNRFVAWILALICLEPAISSTITRFLRHRRWFSDWETVICAANALKSGHTPYNMHLACPGLDPEPYVYAPQVARLFEAPVTWWGLDGARTVGLLLIVPAMAFVIWYVVIRRFRNLPLSAKLLGFAAVRGSTLSTGNIGFAMQALAVGALLRFKRARWPFIAAVIAGAAIKPIFLANLLVLLVEDRPIFERMKTFLIAAAIGLIAVATVLLTAGPLANDWSLMLHQVVLTQQPGIGFAKLVDAVGLHNDSPLAMGGFVLIAGALTAAVMAIAEWGGLNNDERILLGLGLAQLINPRLNDYDLYLMYPALALAAMAVKARDPRLFVRLSWLYVALTLGNVLAAVAGIKALAHLPATYVGGCALVILSGAATAAPHREAIKRTIEQGLNAVGWQRQQT